MPSREELLRQNGELAQRVTDLTERLNRQAIDNAELTELLLAAEKQLENTSKLAAQGSNKSNVIARLKQKLKNRRRDSKLSTLPEDDIELLRRTDWFDQDWYLRQYQDVRQSGMDPILHYFLHGAKEGRDPSARFNSSWYLNKHTDVAQANINPLVHYLRHGKSQGYAIQPSDLS